MRGFSNTLGTFPLTRGGVGKLHAPGHAIRCRYMGIPDSGQTDEERSERIRSALNLLTSLAGAGDGGRTSTRCDKFV